jgi:hypothetical protein
MNDAAIAASLAILCPHSPTMQRVPGIVDLNLLADMGRMN